MPDRRTWFLCGVCGWLLLAAGCNSEQKPTGPGSAGPSLESKSPEERAAAAREAAKKYGAEP